MELLTLGGAAIMFLFAGSFIGYAIYVGHLTGLIIGFSAGFAVLGLLMLRITRLSARRMSGVAQWIDVTDSGIGFGTLRGSPRFETWSESEFAFDLLYWGNSISDGRTSETTERYWFRIKGIFRTAVPKEAFDEILSTANRVGMVVTQGTSTEGALKVQTFMIRPPSMARAEGNSRVDTR